MALRVAIVGGGTAGWMAANLLARKWGPERAAIELIESPDIGIIGVGEGSTPSLKQFFELLDVPESAWMPRCNATYKMGIRFSGWSPASGVDSYRHPFISQLDTFTQRPFVMNCRNRRLGLDVHTRPDDFFINGVLAQQGKGPQTPANFPFRMEYAYHFDAGLLGGYLGELATARGVAHRQAHIDAVETDPTGTIRALQIRGGERVEADFFIDCSGFGALLAQQTLKVGFRPFSSNLFNDAAVVMPIPCSDDLPVETLSTALSSGWYWKIPLTHRIGTGYVYSSDFLSPDAAETELRSALGMLESAREARHLKMRVGQLERHWEHNCLALGLAQGFIEPLEATALHLVLTSLQLFMDCYERGGFGPRYREEFNQGISERFEQVRDYIVAHYKLNTRDDSDYWRANRENMELSDSLRQILDVWYRRGDLAAELERQNLKSHFGVLSWHCLLSGYGAYPGLSGDKPDKVDFYRDHAVAPFLAGCALNFSDHRHNLLPPSGP
jgi:2-polyprenyl-6-methoxyphenol hydroxylase-like FAD-dependent oxidoreductase